MKYVMLVLLMALNINTVLAEEIGNRDINSSKQSTTKDKCLELGKKVVFENKKLTPKESDYWEKVCNKIKRDTKDK